MVATIAGLRVAFVPRHGRHHERPAHRVDYRANVAVMQALGVRALIAPFAAGSLQPELRPGDFVVVDQFVDRTPGRVDTFHDHFPDGPSTSPWPSRTTADCARCSSPPAARRGRDPARPWHRGGHQRATVLDARESRWFGRMGWDLVNMTQYPEAALREVGLPYAGLALVTDSTPGLRGDPSVDAVSQERVFEVFERNLSRLRSMLGARSVASPQETPRRPRQRSSPQQSSTVSTALP